MKRKAPAYQWYPQDVEGSVDCQLMSLREFGAYKRLLDKSWLSTPQCYLPNDPQILAKLLQISSRSFVKLWSIVGKKFAISADGKYIFNPRLLNELHKQEERSRKLAENARKGGRPSKNAKTKSKPIGLKRKNQKQTLSSSFSFTTTEKQIEDPGKVEKALAVVPVNTKSKKPAPSGAGSDSRFKPLVSFFSEAYKQERHESWIPHPSEFKALAELLTRIRDRTLEDLQSSIRRFLDSPDAYHRRQGKPLGFWALNINAFFADIETKTRSPAKVQTTAEEVQRSVEEYKRKQEAKHEPS